MADSYLTKDLDFTSDPVVRPAGYIRRYEGKAYVSGMALVNGVRRGVFLHRGGRLWYLHVEATGDRNDFFFDSEEQAQSVLDSAMIQPGTASPVRDAMSRIADAFGKKD